MKINNWKFTKDYDTFVNQYQHLVGNVYEVYDRDTEWIYKAEVIGFKKFEHYNTIECTLPENKKRKLHINENYINIDNEDFWFVEKIHKDCTKEFEEKYSYLYGQSFLCCYNGLIDSCVVKSLDDTSRYHPKFKCKLSEMNKTVSLHLNDINYNNLSEEEWSELKQDPAIKELKKKYKKYIDKTFEAFVSSGHISTITVTDVCLNGNLLCKTKSGAIKEINPMKIAFDNDLFKCAFTNPDYNALYKRKYKDKFGTDIEVYHSHSFKILKFIDIIYESNKSIIAVCNSGNKNNIHIDINKTELCGKEDWKIPYDNEIKQYNEILLKRENDKKRITEIRSYVKNNNVDYNKRIELIIEYISLLRSNNLISTKAYNVYLNSNSSVAKCTIVSVPKLKKEEQIYSKNVVVKVPNQKKKVQTYIFDIDFFSDKRYNSFKKKCLKELLAKQEKDKISEEERLKKQQKKKELKKKRKEEKKKQQKEQKSNDYDDLNDWYESQLNDYYEAMLKNEQLVDILDSQRSNMCGMGTRKVKLFLNKMIKSSDHLAELYRTALETEDANISAKKYRGSYKSDYYDKKVQYLDKLIMLCESYKDEFSDSLVYGKELSNDYSTNAIIYFELPNCEQISFHTNLTKNEKSSIPNYNKEWDKKVNSTMSKLENAIMKTYKDKIEEYNVK